MTSITSPLNAHRIFRVGSAVRSAARVIEAYKLTVHAQEVKGREHPLVRLAGGELPAGQIDVSYMKFAAPAYDVSPDPKDYVIVDLPIVEADVPNRNMDAFPYLELVAWNMVAKEPVWRTFQWAPTFQDHKNADPKAAKGMVFDSRFLKIGALRMAQEGGRWIIRALAGFDRGKDPALANDILSGKRNAYSMGDLAGALACSCHGTLYDGNPANACIEVRKGLGRLIEIPGRGMVLVHNCCLLNNFVEISSVEDPAYFGAQSDDLLWTPN